MKRQSFRASRESGGGVTEFKQGARVEDGTTNRLLSLMKRQNKLNLDKDLKSPERSNDSSSFSNNLVKRQSFPPPCTHPLGSALRALCK